MAVEWSGRGPELLLAVDRDSTVGLRSQLEDRACHGIAARLGSPGTTQRTSDPTEVTDAALCRDGEMWLVRHHRSVAHLRNRRGLSDLAMLLASPGTDFHVLELAGVGLHDRDSGTMLDAAARSAYHRRLVDLDDDLAAAHHDHDIGRIQHLDAQRAALLTELSRAAGLGGRTRSLGTSATERARKAVTARLREAIHRIDTALSELGAHLDRSVLTGTTCRYNPAEPMTWTL